MFHCISVSVISETGGQAIKQIEVLLCLTQQKAATICAQMAAIESGFNLTTAQLVK